MIFHPRHEPHVNIILFTIAASTAAATATTVRAYITYICHVDFWVNFIHRIYIFFFAGNNSNLYVLFPFVSCLRFHFAKNVFSFAILFIALSDNKMLNVQHSA